MFGRIEKPTPNNHASTRDTNVCLLQTCGEPEASVPLYHVIECTEWRTKNRPAVS